GIGPAGTGKTYLAVACAVDALERDAVKRIVLVRPAVEAGERLGFLPGDFAQKVDPYLRPLYDALYDLMGFDKTAKLFERNTIEIAPLAYMRGRTLNHSFIILDEAQNTTPEQMKMFLTRIGFGTKAVITGDVTQIDLARGQKSGLIEARRVLADVRGLAFTDFTSGDGELSESVQSLLAAILAKPAAAFMVSGTIARLIALRMWCERAGHFCVAMHPTAHLELHEERAFARLQRLDSILLGPRDRPTLARDLAACHERPAALLIELPAREIGGRLPGWDELEALAALARERGVKLHLDGARL